MHGFHSTLLWQTLIRLCEGVEKHHNYNLSPSDCTKIGKLQLPYKSKTTIYSTLGLGPFSLCLSFALRLCCSFFRGNLLPLILTSPPSGPSAGVCFRFLVFSGALLGLAFGLTFFKFLPLGKVARWVLSNEKLWLMVWLYPTERNIKKWMAWPDSWCYSHGRPS